jgi:hypothetical protein
MDRDLGVFMLKRSFSDDYEVIKKLETVFIIFEVMRLKSI